MNIRPIDAGLDQWIATRVTPPRSEGIHVSTVLTHMLKALPGKKYETWGKMRAGEDRKPEWEAGYLWEDVLAKALSDRPVSGCYPVAPFELELDNIFGTPDRLQVQGQPDGTWRIVDEEVKFTWMSCKELLTEAVLVANVRPACIADWNPAGLTADVKFTYWLLQTKTYAAMLYLNGYIACPFYDLIYPQPNTVARWEIIKRPQGYDNYTITPPIIRLRALFINGAYRGELAIPGAWEIEYTPEELTTWWATFRDYAHRMRESPTPDAHPAF